MSTSVPSPVSAPVTPFRGSQTDRALRGAIATPPEERIDPAFVLVCQDDLQRVLDTVEAYERGAPVGLLRAQTVAGESPWVKRVCDLVVIAMILAFAASVLLLQGRP